MCAQRDANVVCCQVRFGTQALLTTWRENVNNTQLQTDRKKQNFRLKRACSSIFKGSQQLISACKYNGFMQIIRNLLFLNNLQGINRLAITLTCHRKFIKSVPRRPTEGKKKKKEKKRQRGRLFRCYFC